MLKGSYSFLSKDYILSNVTEQQIFEKYLQMDISYYLETGAFFCNPLRSDFNPTCTVKYINGKLKFRDWADSNALDCFDLVQKIAGNCSFVDCLRLIAHHFSLLQAEDSEKMKYVLSVEKLLEIKRKESKPVELRIKRRTWTRYHTSFFKQGNLEEEDLTDVFPIECYWLNGIRYQLKTIMFAYHFEDFNSESFPYDYKVYCPYADKKAGEIKFIHNNPNIVQGEKFLKYDKDTLIITSSYKDAKVLNRIQRVYGEQYGFSFESIAPMSETTIINKDKINYYKSRYSQILLYHNNDEAGKKAAETQSKLYNCSYFTNPDDFPKDPFDVVKLNGELDLVNFLDSVLNPPF